jgi:hypothetical protein
MLLTKDQILKADDLSFEEVEVKEWGGTVRVRMMTAGERDDYESAIYDFNLDDKDATATFKRENFRAELVIRTVCDDKGKLMFSKGDIPALSGKGARPVQKLFNIASKLNGISAEDEEELVKN